MKHLKILGIKFVVIAVTVLSIFGVFNDIGLGNLLWISLFTTIITYLIGDLFVFRQLGNVIATLADFGLVFAILWLLGSLFIGTGFPIITTALTAAFFIACVEPFIHHYFVSQITQDRRSTDRLEMQTEFAEETDVQDMHDKKYESGSKDEP
ncbi:MAG TPA: YndM family protein [Bacillota bacterium]|nr:YndM family protein [Bacillota bacterium]